MSSTSDTYRSRLQDPQRARDYATRFERGHRRRADAREQRAVRLIFSALPGCRSVLDVPCGAGRFTANLADGGRDVTGMDTAAEALDFARERAQSLGLNARFIQGDAAITGLPDASVDAIFSNRLLHHITSAPDRAVFLREFHRVTRRHLIISFFDYRAFGPVRVFFKRLKGTKVDYSGHPTLDGFREEIERSGFTVHQVIPTGPFWVSQKYFVCERKAMGEPVKRES